MKRPSRKLVVKKLDDTFQTYIRYRDNWTCITCGAYIPNDKQLMHAGHYIGRGNYMLRWHEKNVNAQCRSCNGQEHWTGDKNTYALALKRRYGESILEELESVKHQVFKGDINELLEYYNIKLVELQNQSSD